MKSETESCRIEVDHARELCKEVHQANIKKLQEVETLEMEVARLRQEREGLEQLVRDREAHVSNQTTNLDAKRAKLLESEAEYRNL